MAAGGVSVLAAGAAEHRLDAVLHQDVEEHQHLLVARRLEVRPVIDGGWMRHAFVIDAYYSKSGCAQSRVAEWLKGATRYL